MGSPRESTRQDVDQPRLTIHSNVISVTSVCFRLHIGPDLRLLDESCHEHLHPNEAVVVGHLHPNDAVMDICILFSFLLLL